MAKIRLDFVADFGADSNQIKPGGLVFPDYTCIKGAAISKLRLPKKKAAEMYLVLRHRDQAPQLLDSDMDLTAVLGSSATILVTMEKPKEFQELSHCPCDSAADTATPARPNSPHEAATILEDSFVPQTFITGGQVGADSIPFSVYEELGVKLYGYMPKGFERSGGGGVEMAARYGLLEADGGHALRDRLNVQLVDAVLAFLSSKPLTGRGTMQTCAFAVFGKYQHVQLNKPVDRDFVVLQPEVPTGKLALVFWDVIDEKVDACAATLRQFLQKQKPRALMISGPLERNLPGIERIGAQILRRALSGEANRALKLDGRLPDRPSDLPHMSATEEPAAPPVHPTNETLQRTKGEGKGYFGKKGDGKGGGRSKGKGKERAKPIDTEKAVLWIHGLGDMHSWKRAFGDLPGVQWHHPTAPKHKVTCNGGKRTTSWFDIACIPVTASEPENPKGFDLAIKNVHGMLADIESNGIPARSIILGGFSQGGATSLQAGLSYPKRLAGIISISGWCPNRSDMNAWISPAGKETPVLMCFGDGDPDVDIEVTRLCAERLQTALGDTIDVMCTRRADHQPDKSEISATIAFIMKNLAVWD